MTNTADTQRVHIKRTDRPDQRSMHDSTTTKFHPQNDRKLQDRRSRDISSKPMESIVREEQPYVQLVRPRDALLVRSGDAQEQNVQARRRARTQSIPHAKVRINPDVDTLKGPVESSKKNNGADTKRLHAFLPLGSVVRINGMPKNMLIIGRLQKDVSTGKLYEYCGVAVPEGMLSSSKTFLFRADAIESIVFTGMIDEEERVFRELIQDAWQDLLAQSDAQSEDSSERI